MITETQRKKLIKAKQLKLAAMTLRIKKLIAVEIKLEAKICKLDDRFSALREKFDRLLENEAIKIHRIEEVCNRITFPRVGLEDRMKALTLEIETLKKLR